MLSIIHHQRKRGLIWLFVVETTGQVRMDDGGCSSLFVVVGNACMEGNKEMATRSAAGKNRDGEVNL